MSSLGGRPHDRKNVGVNVGVPLMVGDSEIRIVGESIQAPGVPEVVRSKAAELVAGFVVGTPALRHTSCRHWVNKCSHFI